MNQESRIKKIKDKYLIHNSLFMIHKSMGFTLVELLASIMVLVAVGVVLSGIISSSLRGTKKTALIENIRQNGNYALAQISKDIEYAQIFNGLHGSSNGNDDFGNPIYVTGCPYASPAPSSSPAPSPAVTDYQFIKVTPISGNLSIVYNCDSSTLTANDVPLVDTASSVALSDCKLTCTQTKATDVPIIGISFKLSPANTNGLAENTTPPILFKTSITIRNYKK